ncbi:MAG TPA: glycosyltransferase family 4 protein [Aquabacterium sp.]|uniref:glycosyltransferase family 4 protein n=1 Tax=Aquabacterium sp. TaxID=1872578 RepID=UPI002E352321|nr:glycosyltransferase family 4 protein [Aquabacterium sp.]HEX5357303.1 glycosyltransferase family 4 protein [Aquabacterium sp.]
MVNKVYIFDSHPVQYKAPVYQAMARMAPGTFEVIYATDASVRSGHVDREFGQAVAWDTPLLQGYDFRILNTEHGVPLSGPRSLTGRGVWSLMRRDKPKAVLLTQAYYRFDHAAYLSALCLRVPILIRQETQDAMQAGTRGRLKAAARHLAYRAMYAPVKHAFSFGHLNREHLRRHGFSDRQLSTAHFSVVDAVSHMSTAEKQRRREALRARLGLAPDTVVIGFFGKLIDIKNPGLIMDAVAQMPRAAQQKLHLMWVGAGRLQSSLAAQALRLQTSSGTASTFCGFVNQSGLPDYYLACDVVVLPSRREAWGLVINEALHAGCAVVMSDTVGCKYEFGHWDRARVFPEGSAASLAHALASVMDLPRDFDWATEGMNAYTTEAAAQAMVKVMREFVHAT